MAAFAGYTTGNPYAQVPPEDREQSVRTAQQQMWQDVSSAVGPKLNSVLGLLVLIAAAAIVGAVVGGLAFGDARDAKNYSRRVAEGALIVPGVDSIGDADPGAVSSLSALVSLGNAPTIVDDEQNCVDVAERANSSIVATFCSPFLRVGSLGCAVGDTDCPLPIVEFAANGTNVTRLGDSIRVVHSNIFYVRINIQLSGCPFSARLAKVSLVDAAGTVYGVFDVRGVGSYSYCVTTPVLLPNTRLSLSLDRSLLSDENVLSISGTVSTNADFFVMNATYTVDLGRVSAWIPSRPPLPVSQLAYPPQYPNATATYPWFSPIIPWRWVNDTPTNLALRGLPNGDAYQKFDSIVQGIPYYVDIDINSISPKSPKLTIFVVNLEDRGYDNYLKKVYQYALTTRVMPNYDEAINTLVNRLYTDWTVHRLPVLSSFEDANINFFLDIHLGKVNHPQYIKQYFLDFSVFIATLNATELYVTIQHNLLPKVRGYFTERIAAVIDSEDVTTFTYWWHIAGMNPEQVLTEGVHNWVAMKQPINIINKLARDQISGTVVPLTSAQRTALGLPTSVLPLAIQYDFLGKMANASTEEERLNVARELMRLLVPNGISFSKLVPNPSNPVQPAPGTRLQGRHVHQGMMIGAETAIALGNQTAAFLRYFTYDTSRYAAYATNFSVDTCPPDLKVGGAPRPGELFNLDDYFVKANVGADQETILDRCNPKMQPVFPVSLYTPFGLGYRGCPGQGITMRILVELMLRLLNVRFSICTAPASIPRVPVAPFEFADNNICAEAIGA